jgi:hypothetical protein
MSAGAEKRCSEAISARKTGKVCSDRQMITVLTTLTGQILNQRANLVKLEVLMQYCG